MKGKLHGCFQNEEKGLENCMAASLTSMFRKVLEQITVSQFKSTYRTIKVIKSSQHGSVKNKSHQNDPISFPDRIMDLADKGEALETICLDFSNALDVVPWETLMSKLRNLVLMKTTEDGHKTSYKCSNQQFAASQKCILSSVLQESILGPVLHIFSIMNYRIQ